jgi:hypothetical protein
MKNRRLLWVAVAGLVVALTLVLWPVHVQQALWAVTVGDEETKYVPVGEGELVTPIQALIEGVAPQGTPLRSTVNTRGLLALGAVGSACVAGTVYVLRRRSTQ